MESGKFAQVRRPFDFHKSIQLAALSHRAQADMAGVEFTVDLDPRISMLDKFVGDEMRLRQVTSNLVSNALKFTPAGSVRLITSLLQPLPGQEGKEDNFREVVAISEGSERRLSTLSAVADTTAFGPRKERAAAGMLDLEKGDVAKETERYISGPTKSVQQPRKVVVRVEVRDTGVGIANDDLDDNQLFSPYVQTEIGRRQGGKGSGLGLALIRQLIQLSGGRLGVDSQVGVGSTFW
jgi:signal transduction histidine kinase